jgi:hypothetical protein
MMLRKSIVLAAVLLSGCGAGGGAGGTTPVGPAAPAPPVPHTYSWSEATTQAAFAGRDGAGALLFNAKARLIGGWRWANDPASGFTQTGDSGCCTTSEVSGIAATA